MGAVELRPGDDPHSVRVQVLGSGFISQADASGSFGMTGMPDGKLRVRFSTTLPGYKILETKLELISGRPLSTGTIHLPDL